jgi:hypothetical protein
MKKLIPALVLMLAACSPPTPNLPPPPPATVIVEVPWPTATAIPADRIKPITNNDLSEAQTFLLILKTMVIAGDSGGVAARVAYPLVVSVDGEILVLQNAADFEQNYERVVNQHILETLANADEDDLLFTFGGIKVGNGELWFNQYCVDQACTRGELKIMEINP